MHSFHLLVLCSLFAFLYFRTNQAMRLRKFAKAIKARGPQNITDGFAPPIVLQIGEAATSPHLAFFKHFQFSFDPDAPTHSVGPTTDRLKGVGDVWYGTAKAGSTKPCKGPKQGERYIVLTLTGCLEFELCTTDKQGTGVKQLVRPGDLLLAEDSRGPAHQWKNVVCPGKDVLEPWYRMYVDVTSPATYESFMKDVVEEVDADVTGEEIPLTADDISEITAAFPNTPGATLDDHIKLATSLWKSVSKEAGKITRQRFIDEVDHESILQAPGLQSLAPGSPAERTEELFNSLIVDPLFTDVGEDGLTHVEFAKRILAISGFK